jgi:hypothetical protein
VEENTPAPLRPQIHRPTGQLRPNSKWPPHSAGNSVYFAAKLRIRRLRPHPDLDAGALGALSTTARIRSPDCRETQLSAFSRRCGFK